MNAVTKVLNRLWAIEFYKTNASFFLVIFGFAGGFMRGQDHIALAEAFIASPLLLTIPISVWVLYTSKIIHFNHAILKRKETEIIFHVTLLPIRMQIAPLLTTSFVQLSPVYLYALFLLMLAIKHGFLISVIITITAVAALHILTFLLLRFFLLHPDQGLRTGFIKQAFDRSINKPYPLMVIEWVMRRKAVVVIGFKIFGILLLYGVAKLYEPSFDERLLGLILSVVIGFHMTSIYEVHRFENIHFTMVRQLPLTVRWRIVNTSIALMALSLPESGLIFSLFLSHLSFTDCFIAFLFLWSGIALLYASLYLKDRSEDEIAPIVFIGVIVSFALILFQVPMIILVVLNALAAFWMIRRFYYRFEYV